MLLRKTENKWDHTDADPIRNEPRTAAAALFIGAVLKHTLAQHEGDTNAPMGCVAPRQTGCTN